MRDQHFLPAHTHTHGFSIDLAHVDDDDDGWSRLKHIQASPSKQITEKKQKSVAATGFCASLSLSPFSTVVCCSFDDVTPMEFIQHSFLIQRRANE